MTPEEAISRMVSPAQRRNNVWLGGILQIWITRACDRACFHCTQNSQLAAHTPSMTVEQFEQAIDSLQPGQTDGYWGVIGLFGGNPATHRHFEDICRVIKRTIPYRQRGVWCNNPMGHGRLMASTFNPAVSNLNVHQDKKAYAEFINDWPQSRRFVKGLTTDSRHSPTLVAIDDVIEDKPRMWQMISGCDINQNWSGMICVVRGQLRGFFCELAGAQAMLHQNNPNWRGTGQPMPDTGCEVVRGWWNRPIEAFADQVKQHCVACGVPLRGYGSLANGGTEEQYSRTHADVIRPRDSRRQTKLISSEAELHGLPRVTDYIENAGL